jgi:hypothetical protein
LWKFGVFEGKAKLKMQNCGGPSGGFILKKKKTGGILGASG